MIHAPSALAEVEFLEASVCIIGGGPAGISIALELADSDISVLLLESGGLEFDPEIQSLYQGQNIGHPYVPLDEARLRYFGGSSNHWNGKCAPMSSTMLAGRSSWKGSAWPIDPSDLVEPYMRAQELCQLSDLQVYSESFSVLNASTGGTSDPSIGNLLGHRVFQRSPPTRFGEVYRAPLKAAKNIHVQLGASVTELITTSSGALVQEAVVATLDGRRIAVKAKQFILATGGLENVRLLLNSDRYDPRGIGNAHGLLGRYFMEHLYVHNAAVAITHGAPSDWAIFHKITKRNNTRLTVDITLPDEVFASENWPVCDFRARDFGELSGRGRESLKAILEGLDAFSMPDQLGLHVRNVTQRPLDTIDRLSGRGLFGSQGGPYRFSVAVSMEQPPSADSRVVSDRAVDHLGQRRIALDWHIPEQTYIDFRQVLMETGRRMIDGRMGTLQILVDSYESFLQNVRWQWHHMGTTRMAEEPQNGVVDPNCRVHGVDNLYVAGSSVFPSGGSVNPTLTICALSVRLAKLIKQTSRQDA